MRTPIILLLTFCLLFTLNAQENLVFFDDFHDNRWDWTEFSHDNAQGKINFGRYEFEHKRETGSWWTSKSITLDDTQDWEMEVSMGHLKGIDNNAYAFIFGKRDENYFQVCLTGNLHFSLYQYVEGNMTNILDWVKKDGIILGSGQLNLVSIKKEKGRWKFGVNGEVLHDMPSRNLFGDGIGFKVVNKQSMSVDFVKISQGNSPIQVVKNAPIDLIKENLGRNINTEWADISPLIAPDGKTLFFVRKAYPRNVVSDRDDIWYAIRTDQGWGEAVHMPYPLNQNFHNSVVSVFPDNNSLLLMNQYKPEGGVKGSGISITHRSDAGSWKMPTDIEVVNYQNRSRYAEYSFSNSRKIFVVSLNREDSYGNEKDEKDLYVSFLQEDGTFSEPMHLGPDINTDKDELSPFLAADDKTLYFSSKGWPGYGSADVFMSRRLDDTWTKWSKPENLGMGINTASWDAYFNIPASGEYAYMVSWNNSIGNSDIFRVELPPVLRPEPVVLVSGTVYDSRTNKPIGAEVSYTDIDTEKELGIASSDPMTGKFSIILPLGKQYAFRAEKVGYYPVSEFLDVRQLEQYKEITRDLFLTPLEKGQAIRINNVFFEFNKFNLKQESFEELNYLVRVLKDNPELRIELSGHTDNVGGDDYNLKLSSDRAASVKSYLTENGISADRLVSKGYGKTKPVATNDTEEGRALNRRVEFTIL